MPFILFENHATPDKVSAETTITNFPASNASDGRTNTQCAINGTGNGIDFDFGASSSWDTLGIARHNFAACSNGTTDDIQLDGKADALDAWTNVYTGAMPVSNDIFTATFTGVTYRYCRIRFSFTNDTPYMSDISIGERVDLQRAQKHGFIKPEYSDNDQVIANTTKGQNLVGLNVKQSPKQVRYKLFYYTSTFFSHWGEFVSALKSKPIYIKHDDNEKAFYCWPVSKIAGPKYSMNINQASSQYYDVDLRMQGFTE